MKQRIAGKHIPGVILAGVILASLATRLCADVVYLKNGTLMKGRIVEKTQEYIVLRSGEGEGATRATIFLEDINKILSDEEFEREKQAISISMFEARKPVVPVFEKREWRFGSDASSTEHIRNLIKENQQRQLFSQDMEFDGEPGSMDEVQDMPRGWFARRRVRLLRPQLEEGFAASAQGTREGNGRISGFVTLPDQEKDSSGDLYVYLMEDAGDGNFISAPKMLFAKVPADEIRTRRIPYEISGVPAGRYKVFAQWDIARPAVKIASVADKVSLAFLGAQGDFSGMTKDVLTLGIDEAREGVDFACTTFIKADRISFDWGEKPVFQIEDIYYLRGYPDAHKFVLVIKNPGPQEIAILPLDIYINDRKVFAFAWEFSGIPAYGTKEFDVSRAYDGYMNLIKAENPQGWESERVLKFTIKFSGHKEREFEKVVYVLS